MKEVKTWNVCREELNFVYKRNVPTESQHYGGACKKEKFKCSVCGWQFGTRAVLINHVRTHTGERPFKCTVADCGKAFKLKSTLLDHVKYKHSNDLRPFKCEFLGCRYSAKKSSNLFQYKKRHAHVANVGSAAKAFACSKVDYRTIRMDQFQRRLRLHSARRGFQSSHPQCANFLEDLSELKAYFRGKHGEGNIRCDHPSCSKIITNASALKEHKQNVHAMRGQAWYNLSSEFYTNTTNASAGHVIVHEEMNEKMSSWMKQMGFVDSTGFACMLCDFVGYSLGAALDHAKFHR